MDEISQIDQASTKWTLANLFALLQKDMTAEHLAKAKTIMKDNLAHHNDWIVLNNTMETLGTWAKKDEELKKWIIPHLERLEKDERKSVHKRAKKIQLLLTK